MALALLATPAALEGDGDGLPVGEVVVGTVPVPVVVGPVVEAPLVDVGADKVTP